jgi:hypothetical protein
MKPHLFGIVATSLVLFAQSVWGQAQTVELKNEQGCAFFHPVGETTQSVKLLSMAPATRCQDGKIQGATVFGIRLQFAQSNNNPMTSSDLAVMGTMHQGTWVGVRATVAANTKNFSLNWQEGNLPMGVRIPASSARRLESLYQGLDEALLAAPSTHTAVNRQFIRTLGELWAKDPDAFLREFIQDSGHAEVAVLKGVAASRASTTPTAIDDPKVRGRSARGG